MKRELVTGLLTLSLLASMLPANAQAAEGMFGASTGCSSTRRKAICTA